MITSQFANPFVLMMHPEEVLRAVETSGRLQRLRRRVFRPLDAPGPLNNLAREAASFDALIDDSSEPYSEDLT